MAKQLVYSGRIIFDHLAKTGGMAVMAWLRNVLGSGVVGPSVTEDHAALIRRHGGIYSILGAHTYFQGEGLDPRYQYVTVLRDPIDRVISLLYFAANTVPNSEEFVENTKAAKTFLQSEGSIVPDQLFKSISNYYVDHFFNIENDPKIEVTDALRLSAAFESLKQFDVVGIFEKIPLFLSDIADLIGIARLASIPLVNQTKERPATKDISPALRARITALNQLDIRLYEQIKAWKEFNPLLPIKKASCVPALIYKKYEPAIDRIVTTPDITLVNVVLREGYDILYGQVMTFLVDFRSTREISNFEAGISILDEARRWAFGINSTLLKQIHSKISRGYYRVIYQLTADLPAGKYLVGLAFGERSASKFLELAWHDNLCEFQVFHPSDRAGIGYANLPAVITLLPTGMIHDKCVVSNPIGQLVLKTPLLKIQANEETIVEVQILNKSRSEWRGNQFFPINLSYHWLDNKGNSAIYDGIRTILPIDGVQVNQTVDATMKIVAPQEPGVYTLFLTIVQENVGWFDELGNGFIGALVHILVY